MGSDAESNRRGNGVEGGAGEAGKRTERRGGGERERVSGGYGGCGQGWGRGKGFGGGRGGARATEGQWGERGGGA